MLLQSTFILLKGIGPHTERRLWDIGIRDWQSFVNRNTVPGIPAPRKSLYDESLREAISSLTARHSRYFAKCLKPRDHWRLFDTFKSGALYLDIETTGGPPDEGDVTVVGLYREGQMISLIKGDSLTESRLNQELSRCKLLVTFFGSVFDLPYLRAKFPGLTCDSPHFDLCFAARRVGLGGGLKRIESTVGISRKDELQGLDGWEAVRLWNAWRHGQASALQLLLQYNESDTRNLEPLAEWLFSRLADRYGPAGNQMPWSAEPESTNAT